jgi:glycosyltransferase involved in cell wall biosynthesis
MMKQEKSWPNRICVVGAGTRFLSGITYYTYGLIGSLTDAGYNCSAILIRSLVPTHLYPGRDRVGTELSGLRLPEGVRLLDGIDWYWGWSILRAINLLWRERPQVLVLQWWTGAVLHSYLLLAVISRIFGAKVLIEFHEAQDVGEARLPLAARYMNVGARYLLKLSAGQLVHSEFDRKLIDSRYGLNGPTAQAPHPGYDYLPEQPPVRVAPPGMTNLLYFGVIRPFKGVEDLVSAFDLLSEQEPERFWLTIVGEPWEGWDLPFRRIAESPYRDRITLVNRYVSDDEAAGYFGGADLVVLPYHRSSSSGPLGIVMAKGLPVVVTNVGGLVEATAPYTGAVLVEAAQPASLAEGIRRGVALTGERFSGASSWKETVKAYSELFDRVYEVSASNDSVRPKESSDNPI